MAVSGISTNAIGYVRSTKAETPAPAPTKTSASSGPTPGTPAATVEISPQALAAAAAPTKGSTATSSGNSTSSAPKVNAVKVAIKEANEPLQLLTKQAKHGDQVAKLLLKQIQKKQDANQSKTGNSSTTPTAIDDGPEGEEGGGHEQVGKSSTSEQSHSSESESTTESSGSGSSENEHTGAGPNE